VSGSRHSVWRPHRRAGAGFGMDVGGGDVLLIGTDGIADPSLVEFAQVVEFCRETFDHDRTLVTVRSSSTPVPARAGSHRRSPGLPSGGGVLR
jgi:hypothetical protein